jgi:hypothetical protein
MCVWLYWQAFCWRGSGSDYAETQDRCPPYLITKRGKWGCKRRLQLNWLPFPCAVPVLTRLFACATRLVCTPAVPVERAFPPCSNMVTCCVSVLGTDQCCWLLDCRGLYVCWPHGLMSLHSPAAGPGAFDSPAPRTKPGAGCKQLLCLCAPDVCAPSVCLDI